MKPKTPYILILIFSLIFLSCNLSKKTDKLPKTEKYDKLIGKWRVTNTNFSPFEHPSFCEKLKINSVFEFDEYGILKVYNSGKTNQNCNDYQKFWIEENELVIFEYDIGFSYEIIELTFDLLKIKTDRIPEYLFGEITIENTKGFMNEKIKFIEENGIIITMEK